MVTFTIKVSLPFVSAEDNLGCYSTGICVSWSVDPSAQINVAYPLLQSKINFVYIINHNTTDHEQDVSCSHRVWVTVIPFHSTWKVGLYLPTTACWLQDLHPLYGAKCTNSVRCLKHWIISWSSPKCLYNIHIGGNNTWNKLLETCYWHGCSFN